MIFELVTCGLFNKKKCTVSAGSETYTYYEMNFSELITGSESYNYDSGGLSKENMRTFISSTG
jgi:predicted transcriptional regulator